MKWYHFLLISERGWFPVIPRMASVWETAGLITSYLLCRDRHSFSTHFLLPLNPSQLQSLGFPQLWVILKVVTFHVLPRRGVFLPTLPSHLWVQMLGGCWDLCTSLFLWSLPIPLTLTPHYIPQFFFPCTPHPLPLELSFSLEFLFEDSTVA